MQLHGYWRSSAAWRVRIALALKGLPAEAVPVHLLRDGGQQHAASYHALNPMELVPTLVVDGRALTQSLAIVEWLEEVYPSPSLLPGDAWARARAREIALSIACDIHPLNNLRVLQYLTAPLAHDEETRVTWYRHWLALGLNALEATLAADPQRGRYCVGDAPSIADICLVPQLYNARRFDMDLEPFPVLRAIDEACAVLDAFRRAAPGVQVDAEVT